MRHAVLGGGGVGGLVGGALASSGQEVVLLLSARSLAEYPGGLHVVSDVLGEFDVDVPAAARLESAVDVLWVTVKASQLDSALALVSPAVAGEALIIPLLNGVDHVDRLRQQFGSMVVPGVIRVESEKVRVGQVVQRGGFISLELAPRAGLTERAEAVATELRRAGLPCTVRPDGEAATMWGKLVLILPIALATSSILAPIGAVRQDAELCQLMLACGREAVQVAATEGADLDFAAVETAVFRLPDHMRSSMQKDLAHGRPPELEAMAGAVVRRGRERGIPTPATEELMSRVRAQVRALNC